MKDNTDPNIPLRWLLPMLALSLAVLLLRVLP